MARVLHSLPSMELFFDRGTIVVEITGEQGPGPDRLPGYFLWDPRVARWRAPGHCLPLFRGWLDQRGIEFTYRSPRPEGFSPERVPREKLPALRPYQEDALRAWTASGRRGLVALPTGSGKTRLAVRALLSLGLPALIAVPTRHLLHQWRASIAGYYPGELGVYGDGEHLLRPITIATYESAHIHLDRMGDHFDLLIIDEAHHLASKELREVAQMATAPHRLGLSATFPERGDWLGEARGLMGPLCFALPLAVLAGSYLANYDLRVIPLQLAPNEREEYDHCRQVFLDRIRPFFQDHPDASWVDFVRAASRSPKGRDALSAHRRSQEILSLPRAKILALDQLLDLHREDALLVFTANNRSAYEISRRFLVPAITCDIERREREMILERFRKGLYRAIVSAKVLNEGLDVPSASVAIITGGSPSSLEHAQRIGRVLRPREGKKSVVYELVITGTEEWRSSERRSRSGVFDAPPSL